MSCLAGITLPAHRFPVDTEGAARDTGYESYAPDRLRTRAGYGWLRGSVDAAGGFARVVTGGETIDGPCRSA